MNGYIMTRQQQTKQRILEDLQKTLFEKDDRLSRAFRWKEFPNDYFVKSRCELFMSEYYYSKPYKGRKKNIRWKFQELYDYADTPELKQLVDEYLMELKNN